LRGVNRIYHFAANMGGVGFIHTGNDHTIYRDNHIMTMNIIEVAEAIGSVISLFYASSACVYPEKLQQLNVANENGQSCQIICAPKQTITYRLEENVVWKNEPSPQHLYGAEKLNSEIMLLTEVKPLSLKSKSLGSITCTAHTVPGATEEKRHLQL